MLLLEDVVFSWDAVVVAGAGVSIAMPPQKEKKVKKKENTLVVFY